MKIECAIFNGIPLFIKNLMLCILLFRYLNVSVFPMTVERIKDSNSF